MQPRFNVRLWRSVHGSFEEIGGKTDMFTHKVFQLLKTRKEIKGILVLQKENNVILCYNGVFLHVLDTSLSINTSTSVTTDTQNGRVGLGRILVFPSIIWKIQECISTNERHILVLTEGGTIWKLEYSDICENVGTKEEMSHVSSESSSSDIFGALLQSEQCPTYAGLSSQIKKNWPIKIDDDNHRLIQDGNVIDFFVFNENVIIVEDIDGRIKIQLLTTRHDEVECRTLLEFSKSNSHMQYPPNGTYMNFICQKATPSSASGIIELKRDLFSSLFSLTSALQNSLIFIYGDQNGKISMYPVAVGTDRATAAFIDTVDIFCDMGQPLLCVLSANVKQFFVCGKETTNSRSRDAIERQINNIKEAFGNENAMLLVGRCGKIIVVLNQIKECAMTMFNTCHVLGPILTASAMNDFLIHATGDTLHLSQLSMSLHVQDKDKPSLSPSFKPVYSIALPISCISQNSISETEVSSRICFYCADTEGQLLDVVIDDKSDNQSNSELAPNINLLLKMLENSQGDFERLQSLLKKQDKMLEELQMAASLTADLMHDLEGNGNIGSQVLRPSVYCSLDSVLMGTDGKLYLDIRIHNTSQHMLSSNWFLQFVGEARQATNNMLYGNLKKFSIFFPLQSLQPKTDMQWKSSINVKELQVFLPIKVEFKLAIPFHESHISAEETASNGKKLFNILPLNSCSITIMDLLHVSDGQSLKGRSSRNNPTSQSNCSSSTCYFCHALTGPHTYDSIAHCYRKITPENLVVLSIPSLILQSFLQSVKPPNAEECAKSVMAHLFPFTSCTSFVEYGTSLHLELPCKQYARLSITFDATNFARGITTVPRLQLEGHCLSLLLAIHSAVVYRLMNVTGTGKPVEFRLPNGDVQHLVEKMQKRLQELLPVGNLQNGQQATFDLIDMLIGLRSSSSL